MSEAGVIFADGIESMGFLESHKVSISIAQETMNMVVAQTTR